MPQWADMGDRLGCGGHWAGPALTPEEHRFQTRLKQFEPETATDDDDDDDDADDGDNDDDDDYDDDDEDDDGR